MGAESAISWTDSTWPVLRGCSRVSEGCRNCYAEAIAGRFSKPGQPFHGFAQLGVRTGHHAKWTGRVELVPDHVADPLRWKKPRRIFISMSDPFHEKLTNEQIAVLFAVAAAAHHHTFQFLTKRIERAREWFGWVEHLARERHQRYEIEEDQRRASLELRGFTKHGERPSSWESRVVWSFATTVDEAREALEHRSMTERPWRPWPLSNVWLGTSVENQAAADERIPHLLGCPAAIRFLSCEPLLGPVDLERIGQYNGEPLSALEECVGHVERPRVDWVIAGCESGRKARKCEAPWLQQIRDACAGAGVAFFLKQAEESADCGEDGNLQPGDDDTIAFGDGSKMKARRGKGGNHVIELPYLDGVQHAELPEVA